MKILKLKTLQLDAKELLTRVQMKNVRGGDCCAHTPDWSTYQCGYSSGSEANSAASSYVEAGGGRALWCCASC